MHAHTESPRAKMTLVKWLVLVPVAALALSGCGQKPVMQGYVSYVWYENGPGDLKQVDATKMPGSRPYVKLYPGYIEIIYNQPDPKGGVRRADYIVPSTSLHVLKWF